ncbi:MAG: hypothetical protein AAGA96_11060, partial [Verrucomicrobiota bacterium]
MNLISKFRRSSSQLSLRRQRLRLLLAASVVDRDYYLSKYSVGLVGAFFPELDIARVHEGSRIPRDHLERKISGNESLWEFFDSPRGKFWLESRVEEEGFQADFLLKLWKGVGVTWDEVSYAMEISKSGDFDAEFYFRHYRFRWWDRPFLALHYVIFGEAIGMQPNRVFSPRLYLEKNDDLQKAGVRPFQHFLKLGRHEKRYTSLFYGLISEMKFFEALEGLDVYEVKQEPPVFRSLLNVYRELWEMDKCWSLIERYRSQSGEDEFYLWEVFQQLSHEMRWDDALATRNRIKKEGTDKIDLLIRTGYPDEALAAYQVFKAGSQAGEEGMQHLISHFFSDEAFSLWQETFSKSELPFLNPYFMRSYIGKVEQKSGVHSAIETLNAFLDCREVDPQCYFTGVFLRERLQNKAVLLGD